MRAPGVEATVLLRLLRDADLTLPAAYQKERRQLARRRKAAFANDPTGPNQVWQLDFSEFETTSGGTWRLGGCRDYWSKYEHRLRTGDLLPVVTIVTDRGGPFRSLRFEAFIELRRVLGGFLFSGDDVDKAARVLSGGEKTRLALATLVISSANVLLLDEPTNNLDPASRVEVLGALHTYRGAVVLVTHDEEAVAALAPERVLLLPDGVEDLWSADYADLVELA